MQPAKYSEFRQKLPELTEIEFKEIAKKNMQEAKMGATHVYFVRHGTSEGKELNLAGGGLDFHGLIPKETDSRLKQKHWGHSHGKPIDPEYKKSRVEGEKKIDALPTFYEKKNFKYDEGTTEEETLIEVLDRTFAFLKCQKPGKNIIAVTHTPVLKAISSALIAQNLGKEPVYHRHDFANGGMIVVDVNEDGTFELAGVEKMTFRANVKYGS